MYDYIIVGQGLAGSVLALTLQEAGSKIKVIDNEHHQSSSLIAGGLVHPMSFRRTILSWKAEELSKYSIDYYQNLEQKLGKAFFEPLTFLRLFGSIEEQNTWYSRRSEPPFDEVLESFKGDLKAYNLINDYGVGKVNWSYRLHLDVFLREVKVKFQEENILQNEKFDYDKLKITSNNRVEYKGIKSQRIIFCEGFQYIQNPYFNYLPQNLTKGEILVVKTENLPPYTLSKNAFLLPLSGQKESILGATYDWGSIDLKPTEEAKKELIEKYKKISTSPLDIKEHRVGIRPTTKDRKPWLGQHPKFESLYIFNGLGSKGVQLAPYFAKQMLNYLEGKIDLDKEVDVKRMTKKHF